MDVEISPEGIVSGFNELLEASDFEGAEAHLMLQLGQASQFEALVHFQFGRLYIYWNKMSSAVSHLTQAAEIAFRENDRTLLALIQSELKSAKQKQLLQRP